MNKEHRTVLKDHLKNLCEFIEADYKRQKYLNKIAQKKRKEEKNYD